MLLVGGGAATTLECRATLGIRVVRFGNASMRRDVRFFVASVSFVVGQDSGCDRGETARLHLRQFESGCGSASHTYGLGDGDGVVVLDL